MNSEVDQQSIMDLLVKTGEGVSDKVVKILKQNGSGFCAQVDTVLSSDVIYRIDRIAEAHIVSSIQMLAEEAGGIVLTAEGIGESEVTVFPEHIGENEARWRIIMDPIDGTRGLMYDKRPAFFLAGAAENKGPGTRLQDISVAVMVEIPTTRMYARDTLTALRGRGCRAFRQNLISGERSPLTLEPSSSARIRGGFAHFARFFTPGKDILAGIEEDLLATLYPDAADKEIIAFEDQYISSGGQLYELLTGKDRFIADVRKSLYLKYHETMRRGHVCHPYDLAAHLIGTEAGLIITDINGEPLDGPFDTHTPMDWIGYANSSIHEEVSSVLNSLLIKYNLV